MNFVFATKPRQRNQAIGRGPPLNQVSIGDKIRSCLLKLLKSLVFRFTNKPASRNSGICRSRHAETAMAKREPYIVNAYGNVKQPRRPKLPARQAPHEY